MGGLLTAISGNLSRFIYAWMLPSVIAVGAFAFLVFPALEDLPVAKAIPQGTVATGLILAFAMLALSVLLALSNIPLYRLLEGYTWPGWAFRRRRTRQIKKRHKLQENIDGDKRRLATMDAQDGGDAAVKAEREALVLRLQLRREKLKQYPESSDYVLPTRLGNALKALETYGKQRYGLDSQTFWYELETLIPERLQKDIDDGQSAVDFFVSFIYVCALFFLVAVPVGVVQSNYTSLIAGLVAVPLMPFFYWRAVHSVRDWQASVQALVNIGRVKLAESLDLRLPISIEDERRMWRAVTRFVYFGTAKDAAVMSEYRLEPAKQEEGAADLPWVLKAIVSRVRSSNGKPAQTKSRPTSSRYG